MKRVIFLIVCLLLFFGMTQASTSLTGCEATHRVKSGETLSGILVSKGIRPSQTNISNVAAASNLQNPQMIRVGQKLCIPQGIKVSVSKPARANVSKAAEDSKAKAKQAAKPKKAIASKVATAPKAKVQMATHGQSVTKPWVWQHLNRAPLRDCGKRSMDDLVEESMQELKQRGFLTGQDVQDLREMMRRFRYSSVQVDQGDRYLAATFCEKRKVTFRDNVVVGWKAKPGEGKARRYTLPSGAVVDWLFDCANLLPVKRGKPPAPEPKPQPQPQQKPEQKLPLKPSVPVEPPTIESPKVDLPKPKFVPPPPISAIPAENELEWEFIAGAGDWHNKLAQGIWRYTEGLLSFKLGNGYSLGGGFYGSAGRGKSKTSAYTWKEHAGIGPQIALKRNFLAEQKDEFGQTVLLPAGWQVKLRAVRDFVSGGNPESGYHQTQRGRKIGLYAEYFERKSVDWLFGVSGEIWNYRGGHITSTWSGDKPQDRGSWMVNAYGQYRLNDDWQLRGIIGPSHQNWDRLNFLNLTGEARYKETLMFGPRLSLPLNHPEAYKDFSRGDLTTVGAFVRVELGGVMRSALREESEAAVQYIGPAEISP